MKKQWQRLELKIDALNLRERALAFAVAALVLVTLVNAFLLDPLLSHQKQLAQQVKLDQQQIAAMQTAIQSALQSGSIDPNAVNRERLKSLKQQSASMHDDLLGLQKGLVSPDKMATLLEDILRQNNKLHLVSLKKLPVLALNGLADSKIPGDKKSSPVSLKELAGDISADDTVYQHAVEIVVQGSYLDLMHYLSQLEAMPWRLFWSKAKLEAETYPKASLTLTLFTLSLDKSWLNI